MKTFLSTAFRFAVATCATRRPRACSRSESASELAACLRKIEPKKHAFLSLLAGLALFAGAGCSSVSSRISKNEAAFSQWPAAVQDKVRAGQIDLGFTTEQVRVALGDPDRTFTRTTADGTTDLWVYRQERSGFSFGFGLGAIRGASIYSGGVTFNDRDWRDGETTRIVFDRAGHVSAVESARR